MVRNHIAVLGDEEARPLPEALPLLVIGQNHHDGRFGLFDQVGQIGLGQSRRDTPQRGQKEGAKNQKEELRKLRPGDFVGSYHEKPRIGMMLANLGKSRRGEGTLSSLLVAGYWLSVTGYLLLIFGSSYSLVFLCC
jgi:hypothetical protein